MTDLTTSRYPLGTATAGCLSVRRGLGDVTISTSSRCADLFEARWQRCAPKVDVRAGTVGLRFPQICFPRTDRPHELVLHAGIPWSVQIDGGAENVAADFTESDLRAIDVNGGAAEVALDLGHPTGMVPIRFGSVNRVTLRRPRGVPVRLRISGGASKLIVDQQAIGAIGGPSAWSSPDFELGTDCYDVLVAGGARELTLKEGR